MSRALVEYVTGWLIDHPEDLQISEVEGERGLTVLELSVNPEDTGKIIGRNGRIIRALRVLARAAAQREGHSVAVEVVD
ncbi:MAG TPA: KH domain-containing protein [Actinomycetota bacterium]|nr:KH domain-containing protein [Actinomycetota bacterium]